MIVTEHKPASGRPFKPDDFKFIYALIEEFNRLKIKDKVWFPMPNRGACEADIDLTLKYDYDGKPYGEIAFLTRRHGMQMAHTVVVSTTVEKGPLMYRIQVKPNKRLRSNNHRSLVSLQGNAALAVKHIVQNFFPGAGTRKVIPYVEEEKIAA